MKKDCEDIERKALDSEEYVICIELKKLKVIATEKLIRIRNVEEPLYMNAQHTLMDKIYCKPQIADGYLSLNV